MGKYLITSSESQDNSQVFGDQGESSFLIEDEEVEARNTEEEFAKDSTGAGSIGIWSDGGGWDCGVRRTPETSPGSFDRVVKSWYFRSHQFLRTFLILVLIAMTLCGITIASPTPSLDNQPENLRGYDPPPPPHHPQGLDPIDTDYTDFSGNGRSDSFDSTELDKIRETIMQDLGLTRIPDPSKANVSQTEYEKAHREYLKRVELSKGEDQRTRRRFHVFYPADPVFEQNSSTRINIGDRRPPTPSQQPGTDSHSIIYFPVEIPSENHAVDHATLRILIGNDDIGKKIVNSDEEFVEVSIYQRSRSSSSSERLVAKSNVLIEGFSPRWAEFDSTEAVSSWIHEGEENLGFRMEIRHRGYLLASRKPPASALNVFTISDVRKGSRYRRATQDQLMSLHRGRRTECRGQNKKCCRHQMTVIFKDLKGFEFIIQPKDFDAGYCKGRCPPRYNPAHHHALLQSLIWKEDRKKAPKPCCAPSKLTELEIIYLDENDTTKLKVSNWKNMKVLECACS